MSVAERQSAVDAQAFLDSLASVDPAGQAWHAGLSRSGTCWQGQLLGQPASLATRASGASLSESASSATFDLWLNQGGAPWLLRIPQGVLATLDLSSSVSRFDAASALLLEQTLLPVIEPLEALLGVSLHLSAQPLCSVERLDAPSLSLTLTLAEQAYDLHLRTDAAGAERLATLLQRQLPTPANDLDHWPMPLRIDIAAGRFSLGELRSLYPGDVALLDRWPVDQVRLGFGTQWQAQASRSDQRLQLLHLTPCSAFEERFMSEQDTGPGLDSSLDELELELVCQAGSVTLSLAELRRLGPGSTLELAPRLEAHVDLLVNGRRVGQGELVKLGDALGVRVLSFATP